MARRIDFATFGGMLCSGVALLLLSSGVRVVEAEDTATPAPASATASAPSGVQPASGLLLPPPDAASCRVDAAPDPARVQELGELRARIEADVQAAAGDKDFVVLNRSGYNYGSQSVVDPQLMKYEAGSQPR
jgi:hypothetical protein